MSANYRDKSTDLSLMSTGRIESLKFPERFKPELGRMEYYDS
jgi:hypothetical protein